MITFILPGLSNSGPEHWQTRWEQMDPSCQRIMQAEWDQPVCADWVATLDRAVAETDDTIVLVSHSSACALVAHWAGGASPENVARVRGALLVGPSDPQGPNYPEGPVGFAPMPLSRLPFPSTVVASEDDQYIDLELARAYAAAWGSTFVNAGRVGHINAASDLGEWAAGYALLESLRQGSAQQTLSPRT